MRNFKEYKYTFTDVLVNTGNRLCLAIVIDKSNSQIHCYVDGKLKQTIKNVQYLEKDYISASRYVVGGDWLGSNSSHFKGTMYSISVFKDLHTKEDIEKDIKGIDYKDTDLLCSYDFTQTYNCYGGDKSIKINNISYEELWLDESEIEPVEEGEYCFAIVGDTQCLSWYHPEDVATVYDWIIDNKDEKNIQYVIGLGDMTEECKDYEWENITSQVYKLSGEIPYSVVMGNHDKYDKKSEGYSAEDRSSYVFNQMFYTDKYLEELDGWYEDGDVSCSYNAIEIGQNKWLLLNLDFGPTDEMLTWASEIIESYPDHKVVISTHAYMYRDGSTLDKNECYPSSEFNSTFNDGDEMWNKLISKHENIVLVLSGHDPWDHIVYTQDKGDNGNTVTQLLINPQYMDKYYDATGMVALLYFSEDATKMTVRYYSTTQNCYGSELSQFSLDLTK